MILFAVVRNNKNALTAAYTSRLLGDYIEK